MKNLDLTNFPQSSLDNWIEVAEKQLKKKNPMQELSWQSFELESIKPFYDAADLEPLSDQMLFFRNLPSHRWKLYEDITVSNEQEANKKALDALMGGCDGIIFHVGRTIDMEKLLKDIDETMCDVSIMNEHSHTYANRMNSENSIVELLPSKSVLNQILWVLENLENKDYVLRHAFADFFVEIASLRALRYLLSKKVGLSDIKIHSVIPLNENPEYQWFLNTTAGLASILGGSHSISMPTVTGDQRITRNIGNLIRDESKLEEYCDQCGGAYYIESLTAKIIEAVKSEIK